MSLELAKAYIRVRADGSGLRQDFSQLQSMVQQGMGNLLSILGVGFGLSQAFGLGREAVAIAEEEIDAAARLGATIKATGQAAGYTAEQLTKMAEGLFEASTFDDEDIINAMSKLTTFKAIKGDVFKRTTESAMDLSAAGFGALTSTMMTLAKAVENPIVGMGRLIRVGVSLTAQEKEEIKRLQESGDLRGAQAKLLEAVEGQVKGTYKEMRNTPAGELKHLRHVLENVKGVMGKELIPITNTWIRTKIAVTKAITGTVQALSAINTAMGGLPAALFKTVAATVALRGAWLLLVKVMQSQFIKVLIVDLFNLIRSMGLLRIGLMGIVGGFALVVMAGISMGQMNEQTTRNFAEAWIRVKRVLLEIAKIILTFLGENVADLVNTENLLEAISRVALAFSKIFEGAIANFPKFMALLREVIKVVTMEIGFAMEELALKFQINVEKMLGNLQKVAFLEAQLFALPALAEAERIAMLMKLGAAWKELMDAAPPVPAAEIDAEIGPQDDGEEVKKGFRVGGVPGLEFGRFGFADLGTRIQDAMLGQKSLDEQQVGHLRDISDQQKEVIDELQGIRRAIGQAPAGGGNLGGP